WPPFTQQVGGQMPAARGASRNSRSKSTTATRRAPASRATTAARTNGRTVAAPKATAPRVTSTRRASAAPAHGQRQREGTASWTVKAGLAQMLKGGVIMDVVTVEHAKIAEEAGACAVMALERVPSDIRAAGGVARMSRVDLIEEICNAVTIPVMAKARIG